MSAGAEGERGYRRELVFYSVSTVCGIIESSAKSVTKIEGGARAMLVPSLPCSGLQVNSIVGACVFHTRLEKIPKKAKFDV